MPVIAAQLISAHAAILIFHEIEQVSDSVETVIISRLLGDEDHPVIDPVPVDLDDQFFLLTLIGFLFILLHRWNPGRFRYSAGSIISPRDERAGYIFPETEQGQGAHPVVEEGAVIVVLIRVEIAVGRAVQVATFRVPGRAMGSETWIAERMSQSGFGVINFEVRFFSFSHLTDKCQVTAVRRPDIFIEFPATLRDFGAFASLSVHQVEVLGAGIVGDPLAVWRRTDRVLPVIQW
ncbi:hypothetical protein BMS3Bbin04_01957 [bacterium BMS3Bbin04]|nr:hypothetical protein BMS3Bbin04_01957 [bacterium BMS3Bbin04]